MSLNPINIDSSIPKSILSIGPINASSVILGNIQCSVILNGNVSASNVSIKNASIDSLLTNQLSITTPFNISVPTQPSFGQLGHVISNTLFPSFPTSGNAVTSQVSIILPTGTWCINYSIEITGTTNFTYYSAYMSDTSNKYYGINKSSTVTNSISSTNPLAITGTGIIWVPTSTTISLQFAMNYPGSASFVNTSNQCILYGAKIA